MNNAVTDHYDRLLARHYSWMVGTDFAGKVAHERALLDELGGTGQGIAIDLGCGPGYQALALAELGYAPVKAVDTSAALLAELRQHAGDREVETVEADMLDLDRLAAPGTVALVTCMGDTLTHLADRDSVDLLFERAFRVLRSGGRLVLTFRNLAQALTGTDRCFVVRSDADRIMTCFLEFEPDRVVVNDLIHERTDQGWALTKSAYRKLRLGVADVTAALERQGFTVRRMPTAGQLVALVAEK